MTKEAKSAHLAEVKLALAKKYEHLAATARSKPRKQRLLNRADRYHREARKVAGH